jgi:hypothetical protein
MHGTHSKQLHLAAIAGVALSGALLAQDVPERPEDVRPLLIGAQVPAVEVRTLDDASVDLQKVVLGKRTLLLFYRGGW